VPLEINNMIDVSIDGVAGGGEVTLLSKLLALGTPKILLKLNDNITASFNGEGVSFDGNAGSTDVTITRSNHGCSVSTKITVWASDNTSRLPLGYVDVIEVVDSNNFKVTGLAHASGGTCSYSKTLLDYSGNNNHSRRIIGSPQFNTTAFPTGENVIYFDGDGGIGVPTDWTDVNFDKFSWMNISKVASGVWTDLTTRFWFQLYDDTDERILMQKTDNDNQIQFRYRANGIDHNLTYNNYNPTGWNVIGGTVSNVDNKVRAYFHDDGVWRVPTAINKTQSWTADGNLTATSSRIGMGSAQQHVCSNGYFVFWSGVVLAQSDFEDIQDYIDSL
jgi:hypothetical protein